MVRCVYLCCFVFFFSSRRRHTRFDCDWSSDVCSSDLYYITLYNENYTMPTMPQGVEDGILKGLYLYSKADSQKPQAEILGSGTILPEALRAQKILAEKYEVAANVWSATSYLQLRREAIETERWNRLHPTKTPLT